MQPTSIERRPLRWDVVALLSIVLGVTLSAAAYAQESSATDLPMPVTISVPGENSVVVLNGRLTNDFRLLGVEAGPILALLRESVNASTRERLEQQAADDFFSSEELAESGIEVIFDSADIAAQITVPLALTPENVLPVSVRTSLPPYQVAPIARLSAGLPLTLGGQLVMSEQGLAPSWTVGLQPFATFSGWTLETSMTLEAVDETVEFQLRDTAVQTEFEQIGLTLRAGQVREPARGLLTSERLLGVAVTGSLGLGGTGGQQLVQGVFVEPIEISQPSVVRVFLNDRQIRSFDVAAGRYTLIDIPMVDGVNEARVEIDNASGLVEVGRVIVPFAGELLERGSVRYEAALGIRNENFSGFLASAAGSWGLAERLTLGTGLEYAPEGVLIGLDGVYATVLGEFAAGTHLSVGLSDQPGQVGFAGRFGYQLAIPRLEFVPRVGLGIDVRTLQLVRPGTVQGLRREAWTVSLALSQRLPLDISANAGVLLRTFHQDATYSARITAGFARRLGELFALRVNGSVDIARPEEWRVVVSLRARARERAVTGSLDLDLSDATVDLRGTAVRAGDTTWTGQAGITGIGLTELALGSIGVSGQMSHPRATASAFTSLSFDENDALSATVGARGGAGLYFADGLVAVGQIVPRSFALVRVEDGVPGEEVAVIRGGREIARSGILGAALVGPIDSRSPAAIELEVPGLPADYSLTESDWIVTGGYRTGTAVELRAERRYYVLTRVVDEAGAPIPYAGLEVEPLFDPQEIAGVESLGGLTFTTETGEVAIYDLVAGEYRVRVLGRQELEGTMSVPDSNQARVELDDVIVAPPPSEQETTQP